MFHMQRWAVTAYLNYGPYLNFTDIFFSDFYIFSPDQDWSRCPGERADSKLSGAHVEI